MPARPENAYNVIAELPGTDPVLKDEVVMIGGHLDSWHTGVGAQPKRTIRVALWGGEEQGLLGSAAWVRDHLAGAAEGGGSDAQHDGRGRLNGHRGTARPEGTPPDGHRDGLGGAEGGERREPGATAQLTGPTAQSRVRAQRAGQDRSC